MATQANAILYAIQDLPPNDKGYFVSLLKEQYELLPVVGNEYVYNKQVHRAEAELIRRTAADYARAQGWCQTEEQCADGAIRRQAQGALMAQLIHATQPVIEAWYAGKTDVFAENAAAAKHLNSLGQRVGMLIYTGNEQADRELFKASEAERQNFADLGWSFYENRDLYNSISFPELPGRDLAAHAYVLMLQTQTDNLGRLGKEQY